MSLPSQFSLVCDVRPETPPQLLDALIRRLPSAQEPQSAPATTVQVRCDLADDELTTYLSLLESIAPYSTTVGFVGYLRFSWDEIPALIYFKDGTVSVF